MLLIKQTGTNTIYFCGDNHIHTFFEFNVNTLGQINTDLENPNVSFAIVFTNDMTRESNAVEFVKFGPSNENFISYKDGKFVASFLALSSGTPNGRNGEIFFKNRGYYSYVIYMNSSENVHPTSTGYTTHAGYVGAGGMQPREIDRGKALIVTTDQFNKIRTGEIYQNFAEGEQEYNKNHYDYIDGEVSYTKHTDKVSSSDIDTDNNFIHVN